MSGHVETKGVSEISITMPSSAPKYGDVVVTRKWLSTVHSVSRFPGEVQFSVSPREEAIRLARLFAQQHAVDVWYSENGLTHQLIHTGRR